MNEAKKRLEAMLMWSDRLGSDEITEIQNIIKLLEESSKPSWTKSENSREVSSALSRMSEDREELNKKYS
jgi:hypothetical protein